MTSTKAAAELLKQVPFFQGLPDTLLWHLTRAAESVTFPAEAVLFREGEPREMMAVIVSGSIAIEHVARGTPARLAVLGAGELIGEGILLEETVHGTSGRALEPTEALVFRKTALTRLMKDQPALLAALVGRAARVIAKRLKETDATLVGRHRALGFTSGETRVEKDLLGEREVPAEALYGVQTLRALENFPISGETIREFPQLVSAFGAVKEAAARANKELGLLPPDVADALIAAAVEVKMGRHHEHFVVDVIQGGAGTSTNMNANEVIASRACELLGVPRGSADRVSPNSHVNASQSTNDVYPTAARIALHWAIDTLKPAMRELAEAFLAKGAEFRGLLKMGRTQLQDAVPMTLGQEFTAFGHTILEDVDRLTEAQSLIREISLGATAIGTGLAAPPQYAEVARRHLSEITSLALVTAPDLIEATPDTGAFVQLSGTLKRCAVKLSKICNDLRLLSSGPRAGFGEITLPAVQPGSSIMPGKVNPVIPEAVNQVCFDVIGGDVTVTMAAEAGQFQLNAFEPVIAWRLLRSIGMLTQACRILRERCVAGITANPDRLREFVERSIGVVTALVPRLGYEGATEVAKEALATGKGVVEIVRARGLLAEDELQALLDPTGMV
jgi:aspartate ammonia-lyase